MGSLLAALVFNYALTLGVNEGAFLMYEPTYCTRQAVDLPLYIDLAAELQLGPVFVGGAIRDDFIPLAWNSYDPLQNTYTFRVGFRFDLGPGLQLEAAFAHSCYHPQDAYSIFELIGGQQIAIPRYEGALNNFYLQFSGSIRGGAGEHRSSRR